MKFTIQQSEFEKIVSHASRAVTARPSHPVLANLLIVGEDGRLSITGFDLSTAITAAADATIDQSGTISLPQALLADIVSRLPNGDVSVSVGKNYTATITAGSSKFQIRGMDHEEYPEIPEVDGEEITIDAGKLIHSLKTILFCVSSDETKQVLTGANFKVKDSEVTIAATDGHRLSVTTLETASAGASIESVTIPGKALRAIDKICGKSEVLALKLDRSGFMLQGDDFTMRSRVLEGQYPVYSQLIPRQFSRNATIDRKNLLSALERIAVIADQKNGVVKLCFTESRLEITVDAADVGSGREEVPCQYSGDDLDIGFNVGYLAEALKVLNTAEVQINLNTAISPVTIVPLGEEAKFVHLIMPVQIRE